MGHKPRKPLDTEIVDENDTEEFEETPDFEAQRTELISLLGSITGGGLVRVDGEQVPASRVFFDRLDAYFQQWIDVRLAANNKPQRTGKPQSAVPNEKPTPLGSDNF